MNVELLPCCKPRLLEQESWGTARNSVDMLKKLLEDSEAGEQEQQETIELWMEMKREKETLMSLCAKTCANQLSLIIETVNLFVLLYFG